MRHNWLERKSRPLAGARMKSTLSHPRLPGEIHLALSSLAMGVGYKLLALD